MKNKVVLILIFVLLFSAFVPYPVNANAAPPPIVTIAVINPPSDLKLSVRYTKDSVTETKLLERWDAGWEAKFSLIDYSFLYERELYSNGVLIVKSQDYNFKLKLPDDVFDKYDVLYTLDLESKTLSEGKPAWQAPVSFSLRLIITLLLEGIVFYLFGYREKWSWILFVIVNFITQTILHVLITILGSEGYAILVFWFGEVIVFIIEMIAFPVALEEQSKWKDVAYAFVGNLLSLILGTYLIGKMPY
ncbi:MAG TPA: hypothetical protein GXX60_01165 [Anaerolineaceae bacterium]|nr:hypothetical protein [Anaerolineaceae bacterium]